MPSSSKFYLYKRSNSIYYIGYFDQGHLRWKSTRTSRKTEALKELSTFQSLFESQPSAKRLSAFISEFLALAETNYAKSTREIYRIALGHLQTIAGDIPLSSVTAQHLDLYTGHRMESVKHVTINVEQRALRSAFNTAMRWKLIPSNPFSRQKLVSVPEQTPIFFTRQDFQKLLAVITDQWLKEIVVFATLTGLRRGELLNLRWQDVDLKRRVVQIQSNPTFKTKQGQKRVIPLNDTAFYLLQGKHGKDTSEYIFTLNGKKIFDDWLTHAFKQAVRDAKLQNERLHFHSLRHTFASWLVQDGASLYEVQKLLGHSSSKITEVYSHLEPEQLHGTVNRISIEMN